METVPKPIINWLREEEVKGDIPSPTPPKGQKIMLSKNKIGQRREGWRRRRRSPCQRDRKITN